jgi:hypothetical protein
VPTLGPSQEKYPEVLVNDIVDSWRRNSQMKSELVRIQIERNYELLAKDLSWVNRFQFIHKSS